MSPVKKERERSGLMLSGTDRDQAHKYLGKGRGGAAPKMIFLLNAENAFTATLIFLKSLIIIIIKIIATSQNRLHIYTLEPQSNISTPLPILYLQSFPKY